MKHQGTGMLPQYLQLSKEHEHQSTLLRCWHGILLLIHHEGGTLDVHAPTEMKRWHY